MMSWAECGKERPRYWRRGAELKHEESQCEGDLCPHRDSSQASYKTLAQVKRISRSACMCRRRRRGAATERCVMSCEVKAAKNAS